MSNYDWPKIMANKEDQELKYIYSSRKSEPLVKVQAAIKELQKRGYSDVEFNFASIKSQKEIDENAFVIHNKSKILRIAFTVFRIFYVVSVFAAVTTFIRFFVGLFGQGNMGESLSYYLPFKISDFPIRLISGETIKISAQNISASINTNEYFPLLSHINGFVMFVNSLIIVYVLYVIKVLIKGALSNNPFTVVVFSKIRNVALVYLSFAFMLFIRNVYTQFFVMNKIDLVSVSFNQAEMGFLSYAFFDLIDRLLTPFVIYVVAEIFRQGAKLKEEQESFI